MVSARDNTAYISIFQSWVMFVSKCDTESVEVYWEWATVAKNDIDIIKKFEKYFNVYVKIFQ